MAHKKIWKIIFASSALPNLYTFLVSHRTLNPSCHLSCTLSHQIGRSSPFAPQQSLDLAFVVNRLFRSIWRHSTHKIDSNLGFNLKMQKHSVRSFQNQIHLPNASSCLVQGLVCQESRSKRRFPNLDATSSMI